LNLVGDEAISEPRYIGSGTFTIPMNQYRVGSGPDATVYYRTGATKAACEGAGWSLYNGTSFTSSGWSQVRLVK
jgi:hypothetical protein